MIDLPADSSKWAEFVRTRNNSMVFHDPAWVLLLGECYGFRAFALALTDAEDEIIGGLPMIEVMRRFREPRWVSLPFTDVCPPLVDNNMLERLGEELVRIRDRVSVAEIEIRSALPSALARQTRVVLTHTLKLDPDPDVVMNRVRASVLRNVRKAERNGLIISFGESEHDLTDTFYELHLQTRRRLGLPIQPRRFFRLLWQRMLEQRRGFLLLAHHHTEPVAGAVFLVSKQTVLYKYGASDAAHWHLRPNDLLFARAIRSGCELGYETFDFGRTDPESESLRRFKLGWGCTENTIPYSSIGGTGGNYTGRLPAWKFGRTMIRHSPPWVGRVIGEMLYRRTA